MSGKAIIAIDGPNAVGKTATARALARLLGYRHLNTGAIYRAVAYAALERGLSARDPDRIVALAGATAIEIGESAERSDRSERAAPSAAIRVNGQDRTRELYTARTLSFTSEIAQLAPIREALLPLLRAQAAGGGVVAEGRDIGTVVFPDADWKFYLDAADWRKADRVAALLADDERRLYPDREAIIRYVREIDHRDRTRAVAPLRRAPDAIFHDTTHSPTEDHDAHVLYDYMVNARIVVENGAILRARLRGLA